VTKSLRSLNEQHFNRNGAVLRAIDPPVSHDPIIARGPLTVTGWAASGVSEVSRVEVLLDGDVLGRAGLHRVRRGVAAKPAGEGMELSGFEFRLDLRRIDGLTETANLGARITLLNGESAELPAVPLMIGPCELPPVDPAPVDASPPPHRDHTGRIRLLCLARSLDLGGSQLRLREFVAHLRADGRFGVTVLAPADGPLRRDLEANGAAVFTGVIPIDDHSAYEERLTAVAAWAAGRFDIVMATTLTSFPAIDLAERLGLPSLWRIGEAEPLRTVVEWLGGTIDPTVEARAYRAFATASAVLFNSKAGLALHRRNGAKGKFAILGTGADIDDARIYAAATSREAIRKRLRVAHDRRLLVCAGTIWPIKGQATLVAALRHVTHHHNLKIAVLGFHDQAYTPALRRFIERNKLSRSVRLYPYCKDLRPWWRAADAALCPSETESMPASVLEAMSFGVPVLACGVGGVPEVVEDGSTGWLCEAGDLTSLIAGLEHVATAKENELQKLGANAMSFIRAEHDRNVAHSHAAELIEALTRQTYPRWFRKQAAGNGVRLAGGSLLERWFDSGARLFRQ
jgi:glycosyltransferase involved in cell wall biosynthesis